MVRVVDGVEPFGQPLNKLVLADQLVAAGIEFFHYFGGGGAGIVWDYAELDAGYQLLQFGVGYAVVFVDINIIEQSAIPSLLASLMGVYIEENACTFLKQRHQGFHSLSKGFRRQSFGGVLRYPESDASSFHALPSSSESTA